MPDLKTFWDNPGMPKTYDLGADGVTSSGSDPNATVGSPNGLTDVLWTNPPVPGIDGSESPNSVSGLPPLPNRFEPAEQPPEPPSLQDRNPGTIDKQ